MIKWFKNRTSQEKWMLAVIVALLVGVAVRWAFIKKEAGEAFRQRIEHFQKPDAPAPDSISGARDSVPGGKTGSVDADPAGWNVVHQESAL